MSYQSLRKYLHPERIQKLNKKSTNQSGQFVAYWVEASQRTTYNHALEYAIIKANELKVPLIAFFGITNTYPNINQRHTFFMLQGLQQLQKDLEKRDIQFIIIPKSPDQAALEVGKLAKSLIVDTGYLNIQRSWRYNVSQSIQCELIQVETDALVPVAEATPKEEPTASQIRPKIWSKANYYQTHVETEKLDKSSLKLELKYEQLDISNISNVIDELKINKDVSIMTEFKGGEVEAKKMFQYFIDNKLSKYSDDSQDPTKYATSVQKSLYFKDLSPYLHFGMISPIYIYNYTMKNCKDSESVTKFLEQTVIRRELAFNFCYLNEKYDLFSGLPKWALNTLDQHRNDKRPYIYTREQLERAQTHDGYWNAAQKEAITKGKMAGHMRMYWGKKVLHWSKTPEEGFDTMNYLNDKYHLDGRDPNGYTGVAWCFGNHDRQFETRQVYGTIRFMVDSALPRKYDMGYYVSRQDKNYQEWRKTNEAISKKLENQSNQQQMQQQ